MDKVGELSVTSRPDWGSLESFVRGEAQRFIEAILEEEVEDFLGRKKSERRARGGVTVTGMVTGSPGS